MGTLTSPSEKKANSECFSHPAALAGSDKKRSMANLAEFTVNCKVDTADLLLYKIVFMLRFFIDMTWEEQINQDRANFYLFRC